MTIDRHDIITVLTDARCRVWTIEVLFYCQVVPHPGQVCVGRLISSVAETDLGKSLLLIHGQYDGDALTHFERLPLAIQIGTCEAYLLGEGAVVERDQVHPFDRGHVFKIVRRDEVYEVPNFH
jgi:hypothetical protein